MICDQLSEIAVIRLRCIRAKSQCKMFVISLVLRLANRLYALVTVFHPHSA